MSYRFNITPQHKSIIKVIGVGGGGSNAVNHMYNRGIKDVEFVVCNTDAQALNASPVPTKLQIGITLTEGLGAGANPDRGKDAALESKQEIRDLLSNGTRMVFITAGMGGGTGTGAAPVIAQIAKDLDILTVGIVTAPFFFEGSKKIQQANKGIEEMRKYCDTVLVISNDKLRDIYGNMAMSQAYAQADNVLATAAKSIAELITVQAHVNVDFEDVKTIMRNAGTAVMGSAKAEGEERAIKAVEEALSSPLLNSRDIRGAKNILLSVMSGDKAELLMDEFNEITQFVQNMVGGSTDQMIFGTGVDPTLGEAVRVTVIATGFGSGKEEANLEQPLSTSTEVKKVMDLDTGKPIKQEIIETPSVKEDDLFEVNKKKVDEIAQEQREFILEPTVSKKIVEEKNNEQAENKQKQPDKVILQFDDPENIKKMVEDEKNLENEPSFTEYELKQIRLLQQAKERAEALKKLSTNYADSSEELKEKFEVPAYLRKNVKLKEVPHSSEKNISKYNLNEENQIVSNNKFFTDKPD